MSGSSTVLAIILVLILGFGGYYYLDEVSPMQARLQALEQENRDLGFRIEMLEQKNRELAGQLDQKVQQVSREKEQEIERLKSTYEELLEGMKEQIEKGEVTITRLADQLSVKIVDRIIFPSGSAEITPDGIKVLHRVGKILKEAENKKIRVEGHTDNVPIHPNLQDRFPTNWELSVSRATHVVRLLQEEVGIAGSRLEVAGYGEHRPVANNRTKQGRAQNRRIEIMLLPHANKVGAVGPTRN